MKKYRIQAIAALCVAVALIVGACGGADPTPTATPPTPEPTSPPATSAPPTATPEPTAPPPTEPPTGPRSGGSLNLPIPQQLKSTDPHTTASSGKEVWLQASDLLVEVDDQNFQLLPGLLEGWSADGAVFTLNVRRGVQWQDLAPVNGREFTADDVIYNLQRIRGDFPIEEKRFYRAGTLSNVEALEAVDSHTVRVTLKKPSIAFIGGLATVFSPMVPKELVDQCGGGLDPAEGCTVGTGPFILESFQDGISASWTPNPNFWKKGSDGQSLPYLDAVEWTWFGDTATIIAAIASGQAAMFQKAGNAEILSLKASNARVVLWPYDKTVVWEAHFNHTKPPFDDVRAREAINLVLERRSSLDAVQGEAPWSWTSFLPTIYGDFVLPESEVMELPGFRDDKTADVARARMLLEEAGYGPDNLLKFRAFASESSTCGRECPVLIADQVNRHLEGLAEVEPGPVPRAERSQRLSEGDFLFFYAALAADFPDPGPLLRAWFHSEGGRQLSGYSNPKMDALLDEQDATADPAKRRQLIHDIQRLAIEDQVRVVWGNTWSIMVMMPEVRGWTPGPDVLGGDIFYDLDEVWVGDRPSPSSWPIVVERGASYP